MYTVRKQFTFSASHFLTGVPKDHPCSRLHGHNYIVEVVLSSEVLDSKTCFVVDYRELDHFKKYIDEFVDHRDLNACFPNMQTTAENLAEVFFNYCKEKWSETSMVRVSETPKTWAEYSQ